MSYSEVAGSGVRNGGTLVVETLVAAGVEAIFGLHGAHVEPVFQACLDHGVRVVDTRHEAAAGHAAEGYARTGRRLGVAVVTAGPGFANVVISLTNASVDRTPVLYLSGAAPLDDPQSNILQSGIDQLAVAAPLAKWAHRVTHTADIPRMVAQAVRVATTAPMGPVYLEIPTDVMHGTAAVAPWPLTPLATNGAPDVATLDHVLQLIATAERPLLLAGASLHHGAAEAALRELAETTGVPVFAEYEAMGLLPASHPLFGGTTWQLPRLVAEHQPDLVVSLGVRFGWDAPGFRQAVTARVVHVDHDAAELGKLVPVELGIVADPAATARALATRARAGAVKRAAEADVAAAADGADRAADAVRAAWAGTVRATMAEVRRAVADARAEVGLHAAEAAGIICRAIGPDALVVADGAFTKHWFDDVVMPDQPGGYLTHGRLGAMGVGMGMAVGAQVAAPRRRVVLVTGDGSVGFNLAEFDTMVRHGLPIIVVVLNNHGWAACRVLQTAQRGADRIVGTALGAARYDQVMAAFGGDGARATTTDELQTALDKALTGDRPTCIEVELSDDFGFPPAMRSAMTR